MLCVDVGTLQDDRTPIFLNITNYTLLYFFFPLSTSAPLGNLHSAPELCDLMNEVATEIPNMWEEVAIGLGLTAPDINRIKANNTQNPNHYFVNVFDTWKKGAQKPYTWETLITTLKTRLVNAQRLANILESRLTK